MNSQKRLTADERIARMKDGPTKERLLESRRRLYNLNPPRWSLRWYRNLAVRCVTLPYWGPPKMFWTTFNWTYHTFFKSFVWRKHAWWLAAPAEAATMRMIRKKTTIPVPRVWWAWFRPSAREAMIFMDRVPGVTLASVWLQCTEEERESYVEQLASMIDQLRSLRSPYGSKICTVTGGPICDFRVSGQFLRGPFDSEEDFNKTVIMYLPRPRPFPTALCHDIQHPIRFTHGDIAPRNIMVKDGRIVALIDWESAGWYPAHWEYVKAHWANHSGRGAVADSFRSYIDRIMTPYPRELKADLDFIEPYQPATGADEADEPS